MLGIHKVTRFAWQKIKAG